MDWIQVLTIIGSIAAINLYFISRLEKDIAAVDADIKSLTNRLDRHASRIDQLYNMFIDLLKSGQHK